MADSDTLTGGRKSRPASSQELHFDVSTGLKRVLGRELITNDEVAIFEMVKNSFDAGATSVQIFFDDERIVVADNGSGMSFQDLKDKWLFVAYSSKRTRGESKDFRDAAAERVHVAGSKGIGRFSSDRLGELLTIQTKPNKPKSTTVHTLSVDWQRFERDDKQHFEHVPVTYSERRGFEVPGELQKFVKNLDHGTIIEIRKLRQPWTRDLIKQLKASLAKLINPFGEKSDKFRISIVAPAELVEDKKARAHVKSGEEPYAKDVVNGRVGNFIFEELQQRTTFINVKVEGSHLFTILTDRGELIYKIREPNPYDGLHQSGFRCELYYLNRSAKATFARRIGLPSVQFGSLFLFRNGFRVYPIGEDEDDWFGFNRRKQQGHSRFLGTREVLGRVDVFGSDEDFQEASSRNQGLIETHAVRQLKKAIMEHCLKRLENYVVPVSWSDAADADVEDISRLLTDPGKARVSASVAKLVDNDKIELLDYSKRLVNLLNERSSEFESSLISLRSVADKTGDGRFLAKLEKAEKRFSELRKSEQEARKVADRERAAAVAATKRAEYAETTVEQERRRSLFLESVVNLDTSTIINLHHQVTIYAVDIRQQIANFLSETAGQEQLSRDDVFAFLEQIAFLNQKVLAITGFAAHATFQLDSEKIEADLPAFITDFINNIVRTSGSARVRIDVENKHPGLVLKFNPIDVAIVVDNLISNAKRAKASAIKFALTATDKNGLVVRVEDNGRGLTDPRSAPQLFEMGFTTTSGSGLGLYHVRQVLGEMGGTIEVEDPSARGLTFVVKIAGGKRAP